MGQVLVHREMPEMGRGQIEYIDRDQIRLLVERRNGGDSKTFRLPNEHLSLAEDQSPQGFERPKAIKSKGRKAPLVRTSVPVVAYSDALARFMGRFPKGFEDPEYLKEERDYKARALGQWREHFNPEFLAGLRTGGQAVEVAQAFGQVFKVIQLMNIPGEWIPFFNAVKSSPAAFDLADAYAAAVAEGQFTEESFNHLLTIYDSLGLGRPKWTVFTYWPYVATTTGFAFVKPTLIKGAADGLEIALNYQPAANWLTYRQAVLVYEELWRRLQPLGARDWVDIQSFLWIGWKK